MYIYACIETGGEVNLFQLLKQIALVVLRVDCGQNVWSRYKWNIGGIGGRENRTRASRTTTTTTRQPSLAEHSLSLSLFLSLVYNPKTRANIHTQRVHYIVARTHARATYKPHTLARRLRARTRADRTEAGHDMRDCVVYVCVAAAACPPGLASVYV